MINCQTFLNQLQSLGIHFYTGVPDSLLKDIGAYIADYARASEHIIAANEGGAIALAAGYHLATGKIGLVYLQNSGLGNVVNPLLSLADQEVYSIPMLLMVGWRGEPGRKDEPQHIKQGRVQQALLDAMEIPYRIIDADSALSINQVLEELLALAIQQQCPVALVVKAGTFESYTLQHDSKTNYPLSREQAINEVLQQLGTFDVIVSTTGKTSRELFELRQRQQQSSQRDFLTVGSMGHASQIALGIALYTKKRVYCLDGDGAILMHMGSLAITGFSNAKNLCHIVFNNGAHDSVGGQPTLGFAVDFPAIARASGYKNAYCALTAEEIQVALKTIRETEGPNFLEIRVNKGSRSNLGRPTSSPIANKLTFMEFLKDDEGLYR
ncbi:phosphonopyruvate decarboxylase [Olivibacter ginsenosidimutans]|uniref:Phosphonopyruvate decarboxylase n=1 Tax=Olivibacter ginsenosidimutans TaxID=1176537 RepID=A0ABP9AI93_9SPHI